MAQTAVCIWSWDSDHLMWTEQGRGINLVWLFPKSRLPTNFATTLYLATGFFSQSQWHNPYPRSLTLSLPESVMETFKVVLTWVCGWNPMVWPLIKWLLFGSTFTFCFIYLSILQNETWELPWILILGTLGNERVKSHFPIEKHHLTPLNSGPRLMTSCVVVLTAHSRHERRDVD